MVLTVFASGSGGNCSLLSEGDTHLLLDAGISMRRTEAALSQVGRKISEIAGVLITHEHSDHIAGLKMLLKYHRLPVYAPRTVANRLRGMLPEIEACLHIIPVGEAFRLSGVSVTAFHTPHDTDESVGYRVQGRGVFALATDMGCVTEEVFAGLRGADTVLIESNHDEQMLSYGPYPVQLKRRILSDHGHLSNENCAKLARSLAENGTARIVLGHLSRENNKPELAYETTRAALEGTGVWLTVAPVSGCLTVPVERRELCYR